VGLAIRAVVQSLVFFALLAAAIFVPAGTLDDVEAWAFLGVFAAACVIITTYLFVADKGLLVRRMAMGDRGEQEPAQKRIQAVMGLSFLGMLVTAGLDRRFGWTHVPRLAAFGADALVALGFVAVFFVFRANSFTSSIVEVDAAQTVVTTGPYRHVRHPMYSGALLMLAAAPIALGSLAAIPFFFFLLAGIVLRLRDEERVLRRDLAGYADYMQKTPYRLVPGIY
jgi:protein-S-isoprenylcysteine O-methyltransferase Ste14